MAFDLATAYARTGLPQSPANDQILTTALNVTLAVVENYLDRKFMYASDSETFLHTYAPMTVRLRRYPVESILSLNDSNGTALSPRYDLRHIDGTVFFVGPAIERRMNVQYTGGYRILPADLEAALWLVFDAYYNVQSGGGSVSVGDISSITVPDVGTVRFATGAAAAGNADSDDAGIIPDIAAAMLRPYMRRVVA